MSRSLIAALLLLIISGSGAAFSLYFMTAAQEDPVPAATATQPAANERADSPGHTPATAVDPSPEPDSLPTAQATPQAPQPDLPSSLPQRPYPTPIPDEPPDEPHEESVVTPEWSVVVPERWAPTAIAIPAIEVTAPVVSVGQAETGEMEAPSGYDEVGWYRHGAKPGEPGRAVLAGHVDSKGGPAIFYRLRELAPGAVIEVTAGAGAETLRYVVRETQRYPEHEAPLDRIFGPSDRSELILITCDGDFDFNAGEYPDRLIVFADLLPEGA